jgi:hypothetical protein
VVDLFFSISQRSQVDPSHPNSAEINKSLKRRAVNGATTTTADVNTDAYASASGDDDSDSTPRSNNKRAKRGGRGGKK